MTKNTRAASDGPVADLQRVADEWIRAHGVRYFDPLTNMAILAEEVGEVARIMARRFGEQSEKPADKDRDLGEELADVLFVVLCLANQTGTDLQAAFARKMTVRTERDRQRHRSNPKLRSKPTAGRGRTR
jgi:NTP pyrophosphatase (non-canonical NTP hydrolase)